MKHENKKKEKKLKLKLKRKLKTKKLSKRSTLKYLSNRVSKSKHIRIEFKK